jgi:hypothetical protein
VKGKEAAQAARRREAEALRELRNLRAELAGERRRAHDETQALKGEIRQLHSEILSKARSIADEAIQRRSAELEDALAAEGLTRDLVDQLQIQKDKLLFNACRYISMTKGASPLTALTMVWTWFTEMDCYGLPDNPALMFSLGLPQNGWVATQLRGLNPRLHRRGTAAREAANVPLAVSLQHAERQDRDDIHPGYRRWESAYRDVTYRNKIELVEDDGTVTVVK